MKLKVLFPCNPLENKQVDPDYQSEFAAVKLLGGEVRLFDFDVFKKAVRTAEEADGGSPEFKEALAEMTMSFQDGNPGKESVDWVYRGWMMTPTEYEYFYDACNDLGMKLLNSPTQYVACHMYPLVHNYIKEYAIDTYIQEETGDQFDYEKMRSYFENKYGGLTLDRKVFVKDWVKSAKETENASVIQDWEDEAAARQTVSNMRAERGNSFNEGYVFKKYVDFRKRPDGKPEEWRAFFVYDRLVSFSPTHGVGSLDIAPPQWLLDIAKRIPSDFYTIDIGMLNDGELVIIETGDGGVSGLSPDQLPVSFYSSVLSKLEEHTVLVREN
jgi:hypothetical protein